MTHRQGLLVCRKNRLERLGKSREVNSGFVFQGDSKTGILIKQVKGRSVITLVVFELCANHLTTHGGNINLDIRIFEGDDLFFCCTIGVCGQIGGSQLRR